MGLRSNPDGRLLEVGCGSGGILARLGSGWQVEGLDVDAKAVEKARAKGLTVHLGELDAQQYPDDYFDVITMNHVIEHVHDPIHLLKECRRILRPKGNLVITTPNLESWGHKLYQGAFLSLDPPRHLYLYTFSSLRALAERAGFTIRSLRTGAAVFAPLIYLASRAIAAKGIFNMDSVPLLREKLLAHCFLWLEWGLLNFKPHMGEELILLGEK